MSARRLRGLKKIVEKIDGADGEMSEGGTVLASSLGWAGSGAAVGSAFGLPGALVGGLAGAIYGVKDGFDQLQKAADAAAKRLQDIADTNRENYRNFLIGERKRIVREETLESIGSGELSDERL